MVCTIGSLFIMAITDNAIGFGINLIYFEDSNKLQFMLKFLRLKIVIGRIKEA